MNCHFFIVHKCFKWLSTCISCGRTSGGCGGEKVSRQWAAYFRALSSTPEANALTVHTLQRRCFKPRSAAASPPCFLCGTPGSFSWDLYIVERSKTSYHRHPVRCQAFLHEEEGRELLRQVHRARGHLIREPPRFLVHRRFGAFQRPGRLNRFGDRSSRPPPAPPACLQATQGILAPSTTP